MPAQEPGGEARSLRGRGSSVHSLDGEGLDIVQSVTIRVLVSTDPGGGPWSDIGTALSARPKSSAVAAAIGYVAGTANRVLHLQRDDLLVCDCSEQAVRQGLTDPRVLRRWVKQGVVVHSWTGLHAKVVVGRRSAWVGSANASISSHRRLVEASVRLSDAPTITQLRRWIRDLSATVPAMTAADLDHLDTLRPTHPFRWPGEVAQLQLPPSGNRLHLVALPAEPSARAERVAATDRRGIAQLAVRRSALSWAEWPVDDSSLRSGDWWIDVTPGRPVGRPSVVRALRPLGGRSRFQLIWIEAAGDARRPRRSDLGKAIGADLPVDHSVIRSRPLITKVFNLCRP